jgi:hypothetical protein
VFGVSLPISDDKNNNIHFQTAESLPAIILAMIGIQTVVS